MRRKEIREQNDERLATKRQMYLDKYAVAAGKFEAHIEHLYDERLDNKINKRLKSAAVYDRVARINRLHD